ncbi:MAG: hypothetical protein A3K19_31840 [Lentisphaerae bacterium RIFOXYB12_FULL_65_16]|nr:MAG: hypothetical protein A3K18_10620 [Lentisphaerae bacterium RIFOXYA12_64_32]OGV88693.1 MAG: hypothetical protein A3K19_31840 [Lentisphaerae bacterium RIFOXYB12_FULL_65_16]
MLFYNLLFPVAFVLYLPLFIYKLVRRGGFSSHFWERFGLYGAEQKRRLAELNRPVWVHAVSVGEVVAAVTFIKRWQQRNPELTFVLSTTTTTGHATARKSLPANVGLIYCPLDFFIPVLRVLSLVRPRMVAVFEVEVWPNLVCLARRRGIPVVLVNARMSDRSAAGYARHRWFFGHIFGRFSAICAQSPEDETRIRRVVGDTVPVHRCNTMKFDQIPDVSGADKRAVLDEAFGGSARVVWIAGSTHAGEEALVADVFGTLRAEFPTLKLVLVPRHQERTADVEAVLKERSLSYRLLRPRPGTDATPPPVDILVVNTTGELMNFYASADVVFVGKCLAGQQGGHNIIEPAIFGKPILHGPPEAMQYFRLVTAIFLEEHASIAVPDDAALTGAVRDLLASPARRAALGRRARQVVEEWRGAIDRTLDIIEPLLALPTPSVVAAGRAAASASASAAP